MEQAACVVGGRKPREVWSSKPSMAEQDTHASHFGGHPFPTEKVTEKVSKWNLANLLGKASTNDTSNAATAAAAASAPVSASEQDRFESNSSIIPPWNPQVNATAVGLLQRCFLPALTGNTAFTLTSYITARITNRLDVKDIYWPLGPLATAWTVALERHNFNVSQTWTHLGYPQKLVMAGLTAWSLRLCERVGSRAIARRKDDPRYTSQQKTPEFWNKSLFYTFLPEALVQSFLSLPFVMILRAPEVLIGNQPLSPNPGWQIAHAAGAFLFTTGFVLEAGADWQLESHQKNRTEGLLTEGLWSIVRHPNYLGDALIHASFPLILYGAGLFHPLMLLAPLANYAFLRYIGGDRENERSQEARYEVTDPRKLKDFKRYQREKNSFWPGVEELQNRWTWIVVAIGAAGMSSTRTTLNLLLQPSSPRNKYHSPSPSPSPSQSPSPQPQFSPHPSHKKQTQAPNNPPILPISDTQYNQRRTSTYTTSPAVQHPRQHVPTPRKRDRISGREAGNSPLKARKVQGVTGLGLRLGLGLQKRSMEGKESEVDQQLRHEQKAEESRMVRETEMGGRKMEEPDAGSMGGSGGAGLNAREEMEEGRSRTQSQSRVAAGFAGYANAGVGAGFGVGVGVGIGSGRAGFRGAGPELEENAVVLEGPLVALKEALLTGRFSDLTIFHGVRVWNAHKVVVCSQSAVLESMIDNSGLTNVFGHQPNSSTLNLSSFPLDSITALMEYLYTSAYSLPSPSGDISPSPSPYSSGPSYSLPLHEQIFYLSVHLAIPALETLAAASFRHTLHTQISNLDIYFSSITRIYQKTTPRNPGLRNALVEAAGQELAGLLGDEQMRRRLWEAMGANDEFWEGVLVFLQGGREVEVREVVREVRVPVEVEVERVVEKIVEREVEVDGGGRILCPECGPVNEEGQVDEEYVFKCECKSCGVERTVSFV
ncbi:hypothetical protein NHQ30_010029 [Ciborinia camelliae]|nr:hypothetical protein NHQ30_010029 [Ciborinia camelliae]